MIHLHPTGSRRRSLAALLAAVGALALSTGVAVLVAAPAHAATTSVNICHATSSDSNPYVFITVDNDSAKLTAHLEHRSDPNKKWKSDGSFGGVEHAKGDPKPDLIGDYVGPDGLVELDGAIDSESCAGAVEEMLTSAAVTFTDPSCENENTASYATEGENVTFDVVGEVAPGEEVTVTATVEDGYVFADDQQSLAFPHTFGAEEDECTTVIEPPVLISDPGPPDEAVTPTVVAAGLVPASGSQSTPARAGLLIGGGAALLLLAAGVARPRRVGR